MNRIVYGLKYTWCKYFGHKWMRKGNLRKCDRCGVTGMMV